MSKVEVKKALKVKVKHLKLARSKMTKMSKGASKTGVKQVNKQIRELVQVNAAAHLKLPAVAEGVCKTS